MKRKRESRCSDEMRMPETDYIFARNPHQAVVVRFKSRGRESATTNKRNNYEKCVGGSHLKEKGFEEKNNKNH